MKKNEHLAKCYLALERLSTFLKTYQDLMNVCMVDFITKDVFENILSPDIKDDLNRLTDDDIRLFHENSMRFTQSPLDTWSTLETLFHAIHCHSLESLGVLSSIKEAVNDEKNEFVNILQHFDRIASDKKMHEVIILSDVISRLILESSAEAVIDVGSGKGYLSHLISAIHGKVYVLGVEGSDQHSVSADQRRHKLEKRWNGLMRRALLRSDGQEPASKGKHWKSKECKVKTTNSELPSTSDNLVFITKYIDKEMDLCGLISDSFKCRPNCTNVGLLGLHTCGNLAPVSLRTFVSRSEAKYNESLRVVNPTDIKSKDEGDRGIESNFPMSAVLKSKRFFLGRNPLMMAAQPRERSIVNRELPDKSLLWRATLQVFLLKNFPELLKENQQVGRLASKSSSFLDYVKKSFEKLNLSLSISDSEITSTYFFCEAQYGKKLNSFYQLRSLFAPVIEGLILLDRLTYLLEQNEVDEAHLIRVFDPVISPRCFAIVGKRR